MIGTIKQDEYGMFLIEYLKREQGNLKIKTLPIKPSQHELLLDKFYPGEKHKFIIIQIKDNPFAQVEIPERLYKLHEINQYTEYISRHGIISFDEFTKI